VALRLPGAEGRRQPQARRTSKRRSWRWCAKSLAPVAAFKLAITVGAAAEDAFRKNLARHHQEDRRRAKPGPCRRPSRIQKVLDEIGEALKGRV